MINILAIETSCDDTAAAVVREDYSVLSNCVSSQIAHEKYGGVVPELASRLHIKNIMQVTDIALTKAKLTLGEIDAVAVSINPGLIGSLLVGVSFAKSLAYCLQKPLIAVNHMVGHIFAAKISNPNLHPPYLALVVSGGHTELVHFFSQKEYKIIGRTRDDAAGEAFDKTAKLLHLGYPGGPIIDKLARQGNPDFVSFPRALQRKDNYDFSFSGLKTAVRYYLNKHDDTFIQTNLENIVSSLQAAIVDSLVSKTIRYAKINRIPTIIVVGGVSANHQLRVKMRREAEKIQSESFFPKFEYCMDNAAMIGAAAIEKYQKREFANLDLNAFSKKGLRFV